MTLEEFKTTYQKVDVIEYKNFVLKTIPNPKVSVRITTYQHANFIRESIDSVLMQKTDFPFEIILGDDESSDGTLEVCVEYAIKFPDKIRLFLHKRENNIKLNDRPTHLFQYVYNTFHCRGEYIAAVAGDDRWNDPKALQQQVDFLDKNKEYVISYYDANVINEKGEIVKDSRLIESQKVDLSSDDLYTGNLMVASTRMIRKVPIFNNLPHVICQTINEDTVISSLISHYGKGHYNKNILPASYRVHGQSIWSSISKIAQKKNQLNTFKLLHRFYKKKDKVFILRMAGIHHGLGRLYSKNGDNKESSYHHLLSMFYFFQGRDYKLFFINLIRVFWKK